MKCSGTSTLDCLLRISIDGSNLEDFDFELAVSKGVQSETEESTLSN